MNEFVSSVTEDEVADESVAPVAPEAETVDETPSTRPDMIRLESLIIGICVILVGVFVNLNQISGFISGLIG